MKFHVLEVYVQQRRDDNVLTAKVRQGNTPQKMNSVKRFSTYSEFPNARSATTSNIEFVSYGPNLLKKKPFVVDRIDEALFEATKALAGKAEKIRFVFEPFIGKEPVEYTVS